MSIEKFPLITLKGTPEEIGLKHGELLKSKIHQTIDWYKNIVCTEEDHILKLVKGFKSQIEAFDSSYVEEIEALAAGANVNPAWIYMLNSRSEIMNIFQNECTALFFRSSAILGQNWDWAEELENLAILIKLNQPNKPDILMMTEPGIIGKIGFNSDGVGVCLNFLDSGRPTRGVPIHLILRKILEATNIQDAISSIEGFMKGKSANILIGDSSGNFVDIEFANDVYYRLSGDSETFLHTNHFLGNKELNTDREKLASSFQRYQTGKHLIRHTSSISIEDMKQILLNRSDAELPICRRYVENPDIGTVGTICSLIMDLPNSQMHITRGSPLVTPFSKIDLEK